MKTRVRRIIFMGYLVMISWLVLFGRAAYMQIACNLDYLSKSEDNMIRSVQVPSVRGFIYDSKGRLLARNIPSFMIKMIPDEMKDASKTCLAAADALRLPDKQRISIKKQLAEYPHDPIVLQTFLNEKKLAAFAELQGDESGLYLDVKPLRQYPLGCIGAHVLGYVGEIGEDELKEGKYKDYLVGEWLGKDGIEYYHERLLRGKHGINYVKVDVSGEEVNSSVAKAPQPGSDLYLTIDAYLQKRTEQLLKRTLNKISMKNGEGSGGAVVAVEANTGFVRALVSLPEYNPNWFSEGISSKQYNKLINDKRFPLMDRAVSGAYPPGSTFKLVTTSAALQEGLITPHSTFYCPGVYYVAGLPFNCFVRTGHGTVNLTECIAYSCDVVYYKLGTLLKLERMLNYAHQFGIGQKTNIDLPAETEGNFPYIGWKEKVFKEKWFPGDDANTAIGQGFVSATPIQMAMMTAAVANGGRLYQPQMVERICSPKENGYNERVSSPILVRQVEVEDKYLAAVRQGMRGTVLYGTASGTSWGTDMAGKTGTAENSPTSDNPHGRNHAWFTGFAPYDDPELVVTVFLEKSGGYGGALAAPIAYDVVREWYELKKAKHVPEVKPINDWETP